MLVWAELTKLMARFASKANIKFAIQIPGERLPASVKQLGWVGGTPGENRLTIGSAWNLGLYFGAFPSRIHLDGTPSSFLQSRRRLKGNL